MAITTSRSFVKDNIANLDGLVGDSRKTKRHPGIVIGIVDRESREIPGRQVEVYPKLTLSLSVLYNPNSLVTPRCRELRQSRSR